ncbi:MAG: hypothetical protein ACOCYE_02795 [Pseudomonadota bacterium]
METEKTGATRHGLLQGYGSVRRHRAARLAAPVVDHEQLGVGKRREHLFAQRCPQTDVVELVDHDGHARDRAVGAIEHHLVTRDVRAVRPTAVGKGDGHARSSRIHIAIVVAEG